MLASSSVSSYVCHMPHLSLFWTCSFLLVLYSCMVRLGTDCVQTTSQFSLFVVVVVVVVVVAVAAAAAAAAVVVKLRVYIWL